MHHRVTVNGRLQLINHICICIYFIQCGRGSQSPDHNNSSSTKTRASIHRDTASTHATHNSCGIYVFFAADLAFFFCRLRDFILWPPLFTCMRVFIYYIYIYIDVRVYWCVYMSVYVRARAYLLAHTHIIYMYGTLFSFYFLFSTPYLLRFSRQTHGVP